MDWQRWIRRGIRALFRGSARRRAREASRRREILARLKLADRETVQDLQSQLDLALGRASRLREELKERP